MTDCRCPICGQRRSARYVNKTAGEECVHPCHWPYLSSTEVARASIALDRISYVNGSALRTVWGVSSATLERTP